MSRKSITNNLIIKGSLVQYTLNLATFYKAYMIKQYNLYYGHLRSALLRITFWCRLASGNVKPVKIKTLQSAFLHLSVSACLYLSVSAFWRMSILANQHTSVSAFQQFCISTSSNKYFGLLTSPYQAYQSKCAS